MKNIVSIVLALVLAACGGGSGGSSAIGGGGGSTGLTVSFSTPRMYLDFFEGRTPISQTMMAYASGTTDKGIYMGAEITGIGIATPINISVDTAARNATITITPERSLAVGTYTGTIKMLACTTPDCTQQHAGSPYFVNYTVTVHPSLKALPSSLSLAIPEGGQSPETPIALSLPAPGTTVMASVDYGTQKEGWLSAQVNGDTVNVRATGQPTMHTGGYSATLILTPSNKSPELRIPINLAVSNGMLVPGLISLGISNATTKQQMQGTVVIALANGVSATSWRATSDKEWFKLDVDSGDFNTPLRWHIDPRTFDNLKNGVSHSALVRVSADNGNGPLSERNFLVNVEKRMSEIKSLNSVALIAGQAGDVLLYGEGSYFANASSQVSVRGATPLSVTRVGGKLIRVAMPALQAGTYDVSMNVASDLAVRHKTLIVTERDSYTYQAIDAPGLKSMLVWDAATKSVFVVNNTSKSVTRYAAINGKFQFVTNRSFNFADGIAMTPDHTALVVRSGSTKIYKLSPIDLSTIKTFDLPTSWIGSKSPISTPLTITLDNQLMHFSPSGGGWLDLDTGATTNPGLRDNSFSRTLAEWSAVSGDGRFMLWPATDTFSPLQQLLGFDLNFGFVYFPFSRESQMFSQFAVSYNGGTWAFNNKIYSPYVGANSGLYARGKFEAPDQWFGKQMTMSRNGSRLYVYTQRNGEPKPRIYVFDISGMTLSGDMPILGYIELNDMPNCAGTSNTDQCYPLETRITISDDDQTLFLAGDTKFLVVPIPTSMRTLASSTNAGMIGGYAPISVSW